MKAKVLEALRGPATYTAIANELGVSRQYVHQVAKMIGDSDRARQRPPPRPKQEKTAGKWNRALRAMLAPRQREDYYGSPPEVRRAYQFQRCKADERGIRWDFTIHTWWAVWEASGKWPERGKLAHQYVMGRHGDEGPYAPDNVSIITVKQNMELARQRRCCQAR